MIRLTCFKSYDIRGKLVDEMNDDIAYRIGRAYGTYFCAKYVVVGSDARLTSESLKLSLAKGLQDSGVNVLDIGLSGTEEVYFATFHLELDGGIEITASHNPIDFNGMKLVGVGAKPVSGDNGLKAIQKLAEKNIFIDMPKKEKGNYKRISILEDYTKHLLSYVNVSNLKKMKLVVNSGNGAAGHVIDRLEKEFLINNIPIELIKIHNEPDGNFPHGIPNPLLPECRSDTTEAVIKNKADMGIAFDGDFDRCFFFDENGRFIEGYYIVGLLADSFLKKNPGERIIHDPRLSWNTIDIVIKNGGIPIQSKTGHAYVKQIMRSEDAIYGGEMSAHHYFRDFAYCDSGMIPWLLVAELISLRDTTLSKLVNNMINAYPSSGEINSHLENPGLAIKKVEDNYINDALFIDRTDGISLEFDTWRFNLRSSNTERVVRLNVESRGDENLVNEKTNEILKILNS
ncbi:phosphomannomutase CpsG [Yersinia enterocolitica]|uniref:phosphomannomutase CpsG n=1 Tax=Yersinia enterocolitica TaxID=630 RepID=UPI0021E78006|nr:phosphomannomutase CpsG [Yersinia enterocolitica]EKN3948943.1 phosphomannomutase CpsG [Yersinia enterocolitica]EKN3982751.1 phosphomannomutase CpsG [Yersinia enterocolitica]EKN3987189.1 phosphomannomutase CpsG [Yersinia enterocolitica]ELI8407671.1 phosphomannomutase CpsG [Yersinia enterocolitica]UYJ98478.1 phosphomannomutase CpsG [Yersinia enterocolitica]